MAGAVVAIVAAQQRKLHIAFERAGATSPGAARTLGELGLRDSRMLDRLVHRGVVVETNGRYYLDLARAGEQRQVRQRVAVMVAATMFAALAAVLYFNRQP